MAKPRPMAPQTRKFAFREDAIKWIERSGFYYVDHFGWCHSDGYCAIVEFTPQSRWTWTLAVYKSAVPARWAA